MTGGEEIMSDALRKLFEEYRSGHALPGAAYKDAGIYELEVRHIMLKAWHYVGHQSQVPERGDYFLFEIAGESVIVVRDAQGGINAMLNVCRHRGSRICDAAAGHEARFTCPYHGWTYGLDGALKAAARMDAGFDRAAHGLRRLQVRVFEGLIFVNFDDAPPDFAILEQGLADAIRPYGLARAKVAHRQNYPIRSNWKLAVENYCECYHCQPAHPEYSVGHGRALPDAECRTMLDGVLDKVAGGRPHAGHDPPLLAALAGPRRRAQLRPLPAVARAVHRQPRREAGRAAARHDHGLRWRHDRRAPRADDLRARVLRPRGGLPLRAARPVPDGLRDHLARQ